LIPTKNSLLNFKTWVLLGVCYCCGTQFVLSQQEDLFKNQLSLGWGAGNISLQDQVFSSLVYRGQGPVFGLSYQRTHKKGYHQLFMSYLPATLNSVPDVGTNRIESQQVYLHYQYLLQLKKGNWPIFLGGGFHNFLSYRTFEIVGQSEPGWDHLSSLQIVLAAEKRLAIKHRFYGSIAYPLLAYVTGRTAVAGSIPAELILNLTNDGSIPFGKAITSGEVISLNKLIAVESSWYYDYRITKNNRWQLGLAYHFRYYQYPKLEDVQFGSSQLVFRSAFAF